MYMFIYMYVHLYIYVYICTYIGYTTEKRENLAVKERRDRDEKIKGDSSKAFDDWLQLKSMRDQALKCLALIPSPQLSVGGRDIGLTGRTAWGSNKDARDEGSYNYLCIYMFI
jgi:hypothetical protein